MFGKNYQAMAQEPVLTPILRAEQPIIYLSRLAAEHIINGHFPRQMIPLGGADYRKAYEDLSLTEQQKAVFHLLSSHIGEYTYAVVTRNSLYFRSDDNCSIISDTMGGVDVSEACRNHDYCYRNLSSPMNSDAAYEDFNKCNKQLSEEIVQICKDHGKECSLNKVYEAVLRNVSYIVYRKRQSKQAEMVHNLIKSIKDKPDEISALMNTDVFNFAKLIESYQRYCTQTAWNSVAEELIYPAEKSACEKIYISAR